MESCFVVFAGACYYLTVNHYSFQNMSLSPHVFHLKRTRSSKLLIYALLCTYRNKMSVYISLTSIIMHLFLTRYTDFTLKPCHFILSSY